MCNPGICMHTIRSRKMAKTFGNMFRLVRHKKIYQIEAPCMGCGEMLHPTVRFYNVCGIIDLFFIYAASILAMFAVHLGIPKDYILPIIVIAVILVPICYYLRLTYLSLLLLLFPWEKNVKCYANGVQEDINRSAYGSAVIGSKYLLVGVLILLALLLGW